MTDTTQTTSQEVDLKNLTWRYAALIGIIREDESGCDAVTLAADRVRFPYLMEKNNGKPVFDFPKAAQYLADISGRSIIECHKALEEEWPA